MEKPAKYVDFLLAVAAVGVGLIVWLTSCGPEAGGPSTREVTLGGVHLKITSAILDRSFPVGCAGEAPACVQAESGNEILSVAFQPQDLPQGQMLAYKSLPAVSVVPGGGPGVLYSLFRYDNVSHVLTLGFEVPEEATSFGLKWGDLAELPLEIAP